MSKNALSGNQRKTKFNPAWARLAPSVTLCMCANSAQWCATLKRAAGVIYDFKWILPSICGMVPAVSNVMPETLLEMICNQIN